VGGRNNNQNKNVQILRLKNKKQNLTRKTKKKHAQFISSATDDYYERDSAWHLAALLAIDTLGS